MKKEKFDLANLGLPAKPQVIKPAASTEAVLQQAVATIHKPETKTVAKTEMTLTPTIKVTDGVKKVSMDLPVDLYKAVKFYSVEAGVSMKDYIAYLIRRDIEARQG
jgi:hypothetical protein